MPCNFIDEDAYWEGICLDELSAEAEAYDFKKFIDFNLTVQNGEMDAAVSHLLPILRQTEAARRGHLQKTAVALRLVLANLIRNFGLHPDLYTAYPRNNEGYPDQRYNPTNAKLVGTKRAVDGLTELGLITNHTGFYRRDYGYGRLSRMRATQQFSETLRDRFDLTPERIIANPDAETIILRQAGRPIPYVDTDQTHAMRAQLADYNARLSAADISVALTQDQHEDFGPEPVDFGSNTYRRIFSRGRFDRGGRFYGPWWINARRAIRQHILIDNQPTVECDYSGQHLHILYSLAGLNYHRIDNTGDPYNMVEAAVVDRDFLKVCLLVALNARSKTGALTSLRNKVQGHPELQEVDLRDLLSGFERKHESIAHHFFSDVGVELQYRDSCLCEYVVRRLMEDGILGLAIHDSFIVQRPYEDRLRTIMQEAYIQYGYDSIPSIHSNIQ